MAGGGGGGGAAPAKASEPVPHPPKDQLPNVSYCITSPPPWPEAILLGFQHYLVMLGTIVIIPTALVPQMGGGNEEKAQVIQTSLFVAGLNTLLQSIFGTRLPAVIGGSYTYVAPTISIILSGQWNDEDPVTRFKKIMRATQGALIIASTLQIVLGFSGLWRNVTRFLSPLSAVPLVSLVGFGLYELGFPGVAKCVEIGLPELVLLVIFSQYLARIIRPGKNIFDRFAVLFTVIIVWIYAHLLTVGGAYNGKPPKTQASCRTDRAGLIDGAPWISIPYPFQWGPPSFNAGEAFAMMMASFVALVESTGAFIAVARYASATPLPPSILSRGVGWQGVGILLSGLFGTGNGPSVSVENAGLLALTRVGSRRVVQISAAFMIFFSILGKFGAVFASIPAPIVGALYCLFFAYVGAGGIGFLQFCNLNSFRTKFILGFSFFLGLSIPQYFNEYTAVAGYGPVHTHARWFNDMVNVPFQSKAFVAGILAFFLDNTMHKKDGQTRKDRGKHWWDKFKSFKTDTRSEEFYSLPFNLNKYFPSV
ncbi:nucleobase-ascorbate transporter 6 [Capsicum annuum]|uniref:nucleobase-ascorbate transporter 6 n=1 Tax=Capsicum annuum TaxID=4072 RepID=UPI0007BF30E2|nr:nucleobase-ascorbate transporter 6 [Capsicum annuum]XP_016578308.1 nucleobase-ascorbate transporter 6 [Capsicum annuum]XP_016578309.1 nucleobase-ascorbate transporter 6 [Capsicum annuum]XP_016578310.1 nucleobase-ascorbate transporter 6 [Capsicum annuum]XP_016578311.1 nucleobase-ascorbate transporter 6 [Capsicum annuum]XP_047269876.1 nucleobase-ascorbate transporter 6 [Capsicum annuum]